LAPARFGLALLTWQFGKSAKISWRGLVDVLALINDGHELPGDCRMNSTDDRAKSIFLNAAEIAAPDERQAFIETQCGGDEALRDEVLDLLQHQQSLGNFLDAPAAGLDATLDRSVSERTGTTIGPYKLLQQIGEGGMGVVFMAEQTEPIQRNVALKIIKPGMDTRQVIARFEAERQAVAMMDHPNIAKVLDAGTTDSGRPYFVMELVKGVPITKYCDEKLLPLRARLELFVDVCQAVQHAHQKGIIHRDIKPNNVLVAEYDHQPTSKVIDFGVAKATAHRLTERTMFTELGQVLGTMEYMSPEQSKLNQLDVDTRSDVYSLGVLLYELLAGSTPFEGKRLKEAAFDEMLRIIREEEPPKPSTRLSSIDTLPSIAANRHTEPSRLTKDVRGELDWIVMKALEKDRNRRYETASGFAADIERHLQDEPVEASPPSAMYRFRKFVRRNKASLVTAALIAMALVSGTVISTSQALRARKAEALAQARLVTESEARQRALTEMTKANAISDLLQDALRSADPDQAKGAEYTVRQLLDDLSQRLGDRLNDQPHARAAVHATIGSAYRELRQMHDAEYHLRQALELRRRLLGPDHVDVASSLLDHAFNAFENSNLEAAESEAREALAIFRRANADKDQILDAFATLSFFVGQQEKDAEAQRIADQAFAFARGAGCAEHTKLAVILQNLVPSRIRAGDLAGAERLATEAVVMHRRVSGNEHPETAWALFHLAQVFEAQGELADAEATFREALALFRKHYQDSHKSIQMSCQALEQVFIARGDEAALAALRAERAARLVKALEQDQDSLKSGVELGNLLRQAGQLDAAYEKYVEVIKRLTPETPPDVNASIASGCSQLARLLRERDQLEQAERAFRQAITVREPLGELAPAQLRLELACDYNDLAFVLLPAMRWAEAERAARKGLELKLALADDFPDNRDYAVHIAHSYIGLCYIAIESGRTSDAVSALSEATAILNQIPAKASGTERFTVWLGQTWSQLGSAWRSLDRIDDAERAYQAALDVAPGTSDGWSGRALVRFDRGQWERAIADFSEAINCAPDAQTNWYHRGHAYFNLAMWDKATADFSKVVEDWPDDPQGWYMRALAYAQWNQPEKAMFDLRQAIAKGYKDVDQLKTDSRLNPLRTLDEFKDLLTKLEGETK
jgi:eukaryotic-like serine/threonine-protein kinase